jgi:transposase-like protein
MKKAPTSKRYSEAFKRQSVAEIESGKRTVVEIRRKYGIGGDMTVIGWLKRYGTGTAQGKRIGEHESLVTSRKVVALEREKRELESALARAMVEKVVLQAVIDEAEAQLGIRLKKNFGKGR